MPACGWADLSCELDSRHQVFICSKCGFPYSQQRKMKNADVSRVWCRKCPGMQLLCSNYPFLPTLSEALSRSQTAFFLPRLIQSREERREEGLFLGNCLNRTKQPQTKQKHYHKSVTFSPTVSPRAWAPKHRSMHTPGLLMPPRLLKTIF